MFNFWHDLSNNTMKHQNETHRNTRLYQCSLLKSVTTIQQCASIIGVAVDDTVVYYWLLDVDTGKVQVYKMGGDGSQAAVKLGTIKFNVERYGIYANYVEGVLYCSIRQLFYQNGRFLYVTETNRVAILYNFDQAVPQYLTDKSQQVALMFQRGRVQNFWRTNILLISKI
jgi:hypothetical protein